MSPEGRPYAASQCDANVWCTSFAFKDDPAGVGRQCWLKKGKCNPPTGYAALADRDDEWGWVYRLCSPNSPTGCSKFQLVSYLNPTVCYKVNGGPTYANGEKISQSGDCTPNDDNLFTKVWVDSEHNGPAYYLKHVASGKCVHPDGGGVDGTVSDGNNLNIWSECGEGLSGADLVRYAYQNQKEVTGLLSHGGQQSGVLLQHAGTSAKCVHVAGGDNSLVTDADTGPRYLQLWDGCEVTRKNIWFKVICVA